MNRTLYVLNTTVVHVYAPGGDFDRNPIPAQVFDSFTFAIAAINTHAGSVIAHDTLGMGDTFTIFDHAGDDITHTEYTITKTALNNAAN